MLPPYANLLMRLLLLSYLSHAMEVVACDCIPQHLHTCCLRGSLMDEIPSSSFFVEQTESIYPLACL